MTDIKNDVKDHCVNLIAEIAIVSPHRLRRFLKQWEKNDCEIDDIIGASLLNAMRSIHSFSNESSIESWFFGVCKNTARQHVAAKVRLGRHFSQTTDHEEMVSQIIDFDAISVEDEVIRKEHFEKTMMSLTKLPLDQQHVFQAVYIDGMSYDEVAEQLGVPLGTLKSRINRMRINLIEQVA